MQPSIWLASSAARTRCHLMNELFIHRYPQGLLCRSREKNTATAWIWSCFAQKQLFHISIFSVHTPDVPIYESRPLNCSSNLQGDSVPCEAMEGDGHCDSEATQPPLLLLSARPHEATTTTFSGGARRSKPCSRARSRQQPALPAPSQPRRRGWAATRGARRAAPAVLHGCRGTGPTSRSSSFGAPGRSATSRRARCCHRVPRTHGRFPRDREPGAGRLARSSHRRRLSSCPRPTPPPDTGGSALPLPGPRTHRGAAGPGRTGGGDRRRREEMTVRPAGKRHGAPGWPGRTGSGGRPARRWAGLEVGGCL